LSSVLEFSANLRQTDMLGIRLADTDDIGMRIVVSKTAKTTPSQAAFLMDART